MGKYRRQHMFEEYSPELNSDENFNSAYRKVKSIKGFYSHLRVYLIVNAIIIITNLNRDIFGKDVIFNGLSNWHTYSTAVFWGIGLLAHGLSVFGRDLFFNDNWEQKQIQKYMNNKKENANKWE